MQYEINNTHRCILCGQWPVEPPPKQPKPTFWTERIPFSLLQVSLFLTFQEVHALGQVNTAWKKEIFVDPKKSPYTDGSFFVSVYVRNRLHNSEKNPMTISRLLALATLGRSRKFTIFPNPHIRHFRWDEEEYDKSAAVQTKIKERQSPPHLITSEFNYRKNLSCLVEGHGLAQLKNFNTLRSLTLTGSGAHGLPVSMFAQIACCSETLERLKIKVFHLKDDTRTQVLQVLTHLPLLKHLELASPYFTDTDLTVLSSLTALRSITFHSSTITGIGLKALAGCTQLHTLRFFDCHSIIPDHVAQLVHLTSLHTLVFFKASFRDKSIDKLRDFTQLRRLSLHCSDISDDTIGPLTNLTLLHSLDLHLCHITSQSIDQLSRLPALRELDVYPIHQSSLTQLRNQCPSLTLWRERPNISQTEIWLHNMHEGWNEE